MKLKHSLLVLFLTIFLFCRLGYGQDTSKLLPEVNVISLEMKQLLPISTTQSITREQIILTQPEDVGTILQKFSGTTLKSYGGLGGLKTISVRGLGSQHTTFVVDGFSVVNTQTGQINLGQLQTDNVESISMNVGGTDFLLPVSSYTSGSVVSIQTFENHFSSEPFKVRLSTRIGSFGQKDVYFSSKYSRKSIFFSAFGKYRQANGEYPYSLQNGNTIYEGTRFNNDLKDGYSGTSLGFKLKNGARFRMIYKVNGSNQGLPGAVILYNTMANQRLETQGQSMNIDFVSRFKLINYRIISSVSQDQLHYTDPFFLNNSGGISTIYRNSTAQFGISAQRQIGSKAILFGGVESRYSELHFSTPQSAIPKRLHSFGLIGFNFNQPTWKLDIQLSAQQVSEENNQGEKAANQFKMNPFLAIENGERGKWKWKIKGWYRNSFRMPSFNELYYNGIGNVKLKPEQANQFSLGFSTQPIQRKWDVSVVVNGFANRVENQILAIPTKNLFVWSMQNIGKVNTFGSEVRLEMSTSFLSFWKFQFQTNYTYQYSVSVTSVHSPTYLNQVAYIPRHTGNVDATLKRRNTGIHISTLISSLRYSLNENIAANQVDGFTVVDFSLFSKLKVVYKHDISIQFSVKNCFNSSYAFIRYFVMPGRNYLFTLNYAFN